MSRRIKFMLDGCDIQFYAEAPVGLALEQLRKKCDRIEPDWCCCGICSAIKPDWCCCGICTAAVDDTRWEKGAHKYG